MPSINIIPQSDKARYLGFNRDRRLTWKEHIIKKRKQMDLRVKNLNGLMGRKSSFSVENKTLIYKTVIKPIWLYATWYVTNQTLHDDLKIPFVQDAIKECCISHYEELRNHSNIHSILEDHNKGFKRHWPSDLLNG